MKGFKWQEINLACRDGIARKVKARVLNGLAIHGERGYWTITHVNSGFAIASYQDRPRLLRDVAPVISRLLGIMDWDIDLASLTETYHDWEGETHRAITAAVTLPKR